MATIDKANKKNLPRKVTSRASLQEVAAHLPEALITYRVSALAQLLSRLVDASVQKNLDLTSRQWRVLVVLNRLGTSRSGEIARLSNFDHSQVSRVAYELVEKGLITQESDATDRRKQILTMTPKGIECLRDGIPTSLARDAKFRSQLSKTEYVNFCHALDVIGAEALQLLEEIKLKE